MMPYNYLRKVLDEIDGKEMVNKSSLGISMLNLGDHNFLVLCRDPSSGEIFDKDATISS